MARMIPSIIRDSTQSNAEKQAFPVLRDSLADEFTVFHSFNLLVKNREQKFVDGEIDYLIYSPKFGFLVVEIKGGSITYDGTQGTWYQNEHQIEDPFEQAKISKYKFQSFLKERLGRLPKAGFGHAVFFPDIYSDITTLPSGADPGICLTAKDINSINDKVVSIMSSFPGIDTTPTGGVDSERIRNILMPLCEYGTSLPDRIAQEERQLFALTEEQCHLLDLFNNHRRVLIEGCAGSGKTVMAIKKARQLAMEGNTVLLLSYNIMIGSKLSDEVKDLENITACNYHRFCTDILTGAGRLPAGDKNDSEYWGIDIPEAFATLITENPLKYDSIIIDEGQDFRSEWWVTISEMLTPSSHFYIFYDRGQNLWGTEMDFPISSEPFVLTRNCRNTREIFDALKPYSPSEMMIMGESPPGEKVIEFASPEPRQRRRQLGRILHDIVNNQGIEPDRIVVLGGHSMNRTCISTNPGVGNFTLTEKLENGSGDIHYHTYMKFKGCEADVVILIDVDPSDERWADRMALYTTISRAKHLLYVIRC
ncbi:NERD domain-containing protein [Chloroflexota bacterium]